jgi:hypothetical protein
MERKPTNDHFEDFLQQSAEDFRINPSPKVWENISKDLNKKRRRFFLGFFTVVISSALIGYLVWDPSVTTSLPVPQAANNALPSKSSSKELSITGARLSSIKIPTRNSTTPFVGKADKQQTVSSKKTYKRNAPSASVSADLTEEPKEGGLDSQPAKRSVEAIDGISLSKALATLDVLQKQRNSGTENITVDNTFSKTGLKKNSRPSRFGLMFFFTPTISYRKLSENKSYLRSPSALGAAPTVSALYDINNAVTHKPDVGLEFGATTKYNLTKNVKLRAGVQFNISRYDIKAFSYVPEVATIALNMRRRVDSVNTVSTHRNFNGGTTDWLQNFYFQISTPIGAEIKVHGNDKVYFGVASTIQPTYVLGDRAYLITADYKNYAQVPWLMRRWNVNTNLETFVAYSTGKLKWQVGPQVRYQLLSSFITEYPVKENLFDFGLKVGVSLNQKDKSK